MRLFVCYVPSLDRRFVDSSVTPTVYRLLGEFPSVRIRTQPITELVPTLITGTYPHEHGIWQVSLRERGDDTRTDRLLDHLPDWLTTTWQCFRHALDREYDLPAIPRRRRRHFNLHRFKYTRRSKSAAAVNVVGGVPTLFGLLGDDSRYRFVKGFNQLRQVGDFASGHYALEMVEFYGLDLFCHWNLDRPAAIERHLRMVDDFVDEAFHRCQSAGLKMILLVDHGQELVSDSIDLNALLKASGLHSDEFHYFLDVAIARFWFETERAQRMIRQLLEDTSRVAVHTREDLREYDLFFEDDRFGELYAIAKPGHVFFPHDFYHPLANLYMALTEPSARRRLLNPLHRGYHGHLPNHPSEEGFILLADRDHTVETERMRLIDFAPSVLSLIGREQPDYMNGRPVFRAVTEPPYSPT